MRKDTVRLPSAYNKYQNQTAQQIKLESIIHFIRMHVRMRKQIRRGKKTHAEPSPPPSRPEGNKHLH